MAGNNDERRGGKRSAIRVDGGGVRGVCVWADKPGRHGGGCGGPGRRGRDTDAATCGRKDGGDGQIGKRREVPAGGGGGGRVRAARGSCGLLRDDVSIRAAAARG